MNRTIFDFRCLHRLAHTKPVSNYWSNRTPEKRYLLKFHVESLLDFPICVFKIDKRLPKIAVFFKNTPLTVHRTH